MSSLSSFPFSTIVPSSSGQTHRLPNLQVLPESEIARVSTVQVPRPIVQNGRMPSREHQMQDNATMFSSDANVGNSAGSETLEISLDHSVSDNCYRSNSPRTCHSHQATWTIPLHHICTLRLLVPAEQFYGPKSNLPHANLQSTCLVPGSTIWRFNTSKKPSRPQIPMLGIGVIQFGILGALSIHRTSHCDTLCAVTVVPVRH